MAASAAGARAIETGEPTPDDPQYAFGREANGFPQVAGVRVVADGETLRVGDVAITAHYTPGHTPGATTWTWRSCEKDVCLDVVYADSLNSVSAPGFRFTGDASHPSLVASFERSIDVVAGLPCDILLAVHPGFSRMYEPLRRARRRDRAWTPELPAYARRAREAEGQAAEEPRRALRRSGARERLDRRGSPEETAPAR